MNREITFRNDEDGNEQWSEPERYLADYRSIESKYGICEVGMFRSPDGKRIMALARSDKKPNLSVMFYSDDEGKTWSKPEEMQGSLAGERSHSVRSYTKTVSLITTGWQATGLHGLEHMKTC